MQHAIIEQIETCELKATEWRVAMRLLHQADTQGRVRLSREACVALCQVHVWGAAARILCRLVGHGLIGWYSDRQGVHVYFTGWGAPALAVEKEREQEALGRLHTGGMESKAGSAPVNSAPQGTLPGDMSNVPLILQAMTDMTRQNGALLGLLTDLTRQIGVLLGALMNGDRPSAVLGLDEARQNGACAEAFDPGRAEAAREARQNGACAEAFDLGRAEAARETRQNGAPSCHLTDTRVATAGSLPHTYAGARVGADGPSVGLSDLKGADLQTDRQTALAAAASSCEGMRLRPDGETVQTPSPYGAARPLASPAVVPGIEPELALGLLTSREVGLPLRDAEVVAYLHPFWRIRDCVFYFLNERMAKRFRSPRIMLTWLANWEQWVIPATNEVDAETALYQRYLLPAERQARAEQEARLLELEEGGDGEHGAGLRRETSASSVESLSRTGNEQGFDASVRLSGSTRARDKGQGAGGAVDISGVAPVVDERLAVWQTVLSDLALQMPATAYNTWIRDTWLSDVEKAPSREGGPPGEDAEAGDEMWLIGVANEYAVDWLRNRLHGKIVRAIQTLVGRTVRVQFAVLPRPGLAQPLCAV